MKLKTLAVYMAAVCLGAQSAPPAAGPDQKAEEARVAERAKRFYELLVGGKARASEEFVCEASKDEYYAAPKTKPLGAEVGRVQIDPDGKTALVLTMVEDEHILPMAGQKRVMKMSTPTTWKLENGQWCYYLEPAPPKTAAEPAKPPVDAAALARLGQPPPGVKPADLPQAGAQGDGLEAAVQDPGRRGWERRDRHHQRAERPGQASVWVPQGSGPGVQIGQGIDWSQRPGQADGGIQVQRH